MPFPTIGQTIAAAVPRQDARAELRGWALLALSSLAIAGVFALLLAVSRIPGIETVLSVMLGFFPKGLVIHVVFAFVVWFLTVFALLTSVVAHQLADNGRPALGWAGPAGQAMTMVAFPLLFLPSFLPDTHGFLNNYVPVIDHPMYMTGIVFLYGGVLLPVIRLLANLPGRNQPLESGQMAIACGGLIYIMAMLTLAIAAVNGWNRDPDQTYFEDLFWGSGHILSFLNTLLMLAGWQYVGRLALGRDPVDPKLFRVAMLLLSLSTVPAPIVSIAMRHSAKLPIFFTDIQYGLAAPVLFVAIGLIASLVAWKSETQGRFRDHPMLLCLVLSMAVFTVGGLFGFMVDGHDTRTPAHYHGMIAGVNLALMGLFLFVIPDLIGRRRPQKRLKLQLMMFGTGQLLACIGLFWAGGYGAPRKIAGAAQGLIPIAKIGMYLNGVGALIAVIGGIIFVWTALRYVASSSRP